MGDFIWGFDGKPRSQEQIDQQNRLADALSQNQQPVNSWAQGLSNMINSFLGGFERGSAAKESDDNEEYSSNLIKGLLGSPEQSGAAPAPTSTQADTTPSPVQQIATNLAQPSPQNNSQPLTVGQAAGQGAKDLIAQHFVDQMRQAESGGDNNAKNPLSSATGPFQFTNGTWNGLMQQHPELGLTADGRTDPQQSEAAAKQLASDNIAYLLSKGVQNPTDGQAYLAHFAGAPTAANLIQASPNTPVSSIMSPQQIAANPFLRGMTAGGVQNWANTQMGATASAPPQQQAAQIPAQQTPSYQPPAGPSMGAVLNVLADPRANQQAKGIAGAMLQNQLQLQQVAQRYQMEQADPENVARRRYYDMETQALQQRMSAPAKQGPEYRLLSPQEKQTLGLPAVGNYQMDATGKVSAIGGGGVNVLPSAPAGYYYQPGPDGQATLQPVPGGPVDTANKNKSDSNTTTNDVLTRTASDLFGLLKSNPRLSAGALSIPLSYSPESSAAQLRRLNSTLGAIGSLSSLQQMRDQSPTGGALGNVTEKEEALLAQKFGTLDPNSSPDVYEKNARDYVKTLYQIVNGNEAGQSLFNKYFSEATHQSSQAAPQSGALPPSVSSIIDAAKPIAPGVTYRKGG